jgi:FixJ family two-component response regulator
LAHKDRIPVIFISGYGDVPMTVQVMKAGAVDFLQKPFREQELLECVQGALRRDQSQRELEEQVAGVLVGYRSLTKREKEIMKLVVTGQINKQIAAQVGLSEVTVKIHSAQVMHKMGTPSLADLVRAADKIEAFLA